MAQAVRPYRDKSWLYDKYWRQDMSLYEVADMADVSFTTIQYWFTKYGIPKRNGGRSDAYIFDRTIDAETLERLQYSEGLTLKQMAAEYNVSRGHVRNKMEAFGIDRKSTGAHHRDSVPYCTLSHKENGYVYWVSVWRGKRDQMAVHRLAAIAEYGTDAVNGNEIHHTNGISWLNVPVFEADIPELKQRNLVPLDGVAHQRGKH